MTRASSSLVLALLAASGCTTTFTDTTDVVSGPRLLAVQTVPAEVAPGAAFTLAPLYVGPGGALDPSSLDWASCLLQKPLGEPGPINPACFVDSSSDLVALGAVGSGGTVSATMDASACELFGPDSPPPKAGQPAARPTDPDTTGGFYFPVRVKAPADASDPWSVSLERVSCQPSGVTSTVFSAYETQYQANANPTVAALAHVAADGTQTPIAPDAPGTTSALTVTAGAKTTLQVSWPDCTTAPSSATGCGGAESYVLIDPTSRQLVTQRESMVASWFTTGGAFDLARVGRDATDTAPNISDTWTAPTVAGTVHVWVVLRDSRGGTGWASFTIAVQ